MIFLESPWPWLLIGIVAEAILAAILVTTRRGALLWAMVSVLGLVLAGLVVERVVVTEQERVEMAMDGLLAALNSNDLNRLLSEYIAPDAATTRTRASWALGRVEVQRANYHNLRITINRLTSPITAEAQFDGMISYRDRLGEIPYGNYMAHFEMELEKRDERWLVTDHVEYNPVTGARQDDQY